MSDSHSMPADEPAGQRTTFTERYARPRLASDTGRAEAADDADGYKPYGLVPTSSIGESCDVRRWVDGTDTPEGVEFSYRLLLQVQYTGDHDLRLYLPDCVIAIGGRSLLDLRKRLMRRMVTFIQQYNPRLWPHPAEGEAIVETIELIRAETFRRT